MMIVAVSSILFMGHMGAFAAVPLPAPQVSRSRTVPQDKHPKKKKRSTRTRRSHHAPRLIDIPVDPAHGGRSITAASLHKGDLILSTTRHITSQIINRFTGGGPASHVRIYIGSNQIIEAVSGGVTVGDLSAAMQDDTFDVVVRIPNATTAQIDQAVDYAWTKIGLPYNTWGAVLDGLFDNLGARVTINVGTNPNRFFCSELVIQAYAAANIDLTQSGPVWSPNNVVSLLWTDRLKYAGHRAHAGACEDGVEEPRIRRFSRRTSRDAERVRSLSRRRRRRQ